MPRLADVQTFIDQSRQVASPADLHGLMQAVSGEMGFDHFALIHHVDLRPMGTLAEPLVTDDYVALTDYPQAWVDQYVGDAIVANDPILLASQRMNIGFEWAKVAELVKLTSKHREVLERAQNAGLQNGFTVPANVPGELNGSCNFAVRARHEIKRSNFAMAQLVGAFAFQAARELVARMRDVKDYEPPKLTDRQLECIVLVARGKTDWEIGKILGISEETVKMHLRNAREMFGVSKRIQVVMRTLFSGQVPLTELVD
jgi:LuxR family quorum-sensing system transcriptional regulator CciR